MMLTNNEKRPTKGNCKTMDNYIQWELQTMGITDNRELQTIGNE